MNELNENIFYLNNKSKNMIYLTGNDIMDFYIHRELDEENFIQDETLLIQIKESTTGLVFYAVDTEKICFFVHKGINTFYELEYEKMSLVKSKKWYNKQIENDIQRTKFLVDEYKEFIEEKSRYY